MTFLKISVTQMLGLNKLHMLVYILHELDQTRSVLLTLPYVVFIHSANYVLSGARLIYHMCTTGARPVLR